MAGVYQGRREDVEGMESEGEGDEVNESESEGPREKGMRRGRARRSGEWGELTGDALGKLQGISDAFLFRAFGFLFFFVAPIQLQFSLFFPPLLPLLQDLLYWVPSLQALRTSTMELLGADPRSEERSALSQASSLPPWKRKCE